MGYIVLHGKMREERESEFERGREAEREKRGRDVARGSGSVADEEIVNLQYMLSKSVVKSRPNVLWCYRDKLQLSRDLRISSIEVKYGEWALKVVTWIDGRNRGRAKVEIDVLPVVVIQVHSGEFGLGFIFDNIPMLLFTHTSYGMPAVTKQCVSQVRVIIVKLADILHNMRTLLHMPSHKQSSITKETLKVFAPLAKLLGMYQIKPFNLEFLYIAQIHIIVKPKPCVGVGPLCNAQQICYQVLGVVYGIWNPIPRAMKDYTTTPKPNGYQSIHTTVTLFLYESTFRLEVKIKTEEMNLIASRGIAAHYSGKVFVNDLVRHTVRDEDRNFGGKIIGLNNANVALRLFIIFGLETEDWGWAEFSNNQTVPNAGELEKALNDLTTKLNEEAAGGNLVKKYASGTVTYGPSAIRLLLDPATHKEFMRLKVSRLYTFSYTLL
ncbi:putative GTP diphosphokinase RSH1, chloroplastic [Tanacetum coccineum]